MEANIIKDLIFWYIFCGVIFYLIGWFWAFLTDDFSMSCDNRNKRRMARVTLIWPFWPIIFVFICTRWIVKLLILIIKLADFGDIYGRQNRKKD